jgi:AAA15 family ATPase/GTPase
MIQCISVSNFRSIKDATIDLPDHFGAILGPNGAGKSNLIHALAYLKGLATGRNADEVAKDMKKNMHAHAKKEKNQRYIKNLRKNFGLYEFSKMQTSTKYL